MSANVWLQAASTCRTTSIPSLPKAESTVSLSNKRSKKKLSRVRASLGNGSENSPPPSTGKNPLSIVTDVPRTIWRRTLQPLSDFGFGRRSVWEGGVGLFMVSGAALLALTLVWLRGFYMRSRFRKYQAVFEFTQASGICLGTPVRIRGVTIGTVIRVNASLKGVDAVVEVCIFFWSI